MADYVVSTDFGAKDNLLSGNPAKLIKGSEFTTEFDNIATAIATKIDDNGALGTPVSGTLTNCTGLPVSSGVSGLGTGVATALGINVGSAGSPVTNGGALGTPSSGTLTNCTGLPLSGLTGIAALSAPVANSLNTVTAVTATANQSIRVNAGGTAWEAYTPSTGTGDVTGQSSSVDSEIALFSGTGGKTIKRATTTGILKATSGVIAAATQGTDYGYVDIPQSGSDKTTSYSLATSDNGKFIGVGSGGSITIPDATFSAGNAVTIFNNTTGNVTITCTITTAYIAGTDSDKATMTLATRGVANILFLSGTVCVVTGNVS